MVSAVVLVCDATQPHPAEPEAVVASLAALVPAVVAGLVREASLAVTAGDAAMRDIADYAGCQLVEAVAAADVLPAALAAARGPCVLVLRAGCVPDQGFAEELADFLRAGADECAVLRQTPLRGLARIFPWLAPVAGVIGTQPRLRQARRQSLKDLSRALRPRRVFHCRTTRAG
jgi:hypothetical protein